jgi:6-pyruvoyltetrahydropterin/6-carboxytetrahydropterin synthase
VEVELAASDVDRVGFVFDYLELAWVKSWLDLTFDHQHLNERMSVNPTAENIAKVVFDQCAKSLDLPLGVCVEAVRVMETPKTTAEYRP